jgi:hypothetical protein
MGLDEERLTATQRAILGVPLHLALLSEILEPDGEQTRALDFTTTSELYEKFWDAKQRELQGRLGRVPAWTAVLDRLVNDMSEKQLLRAQREIVDEWQLDVEAMVSSRVLTTDGAHLAFFHETFFDYVFARRFSARGRTVAGLLSSDQFLFRRAQVRQILAYSRGRARSYRDDLAFLLTDETVRFHIRDLVVSWLAQVHPSVDEWELLKPHLDDAASPLHGRAWQTLASPAWLRAADACGYLTHCLENATHVDAVVHAIRLGGTGFSDRTVELLRPYIDDPEWIQRVVWIVQRADLAKSPALFDLFLELLDSGGLDRLGLTRQDFWYIAHDLPKSAPTRANRLLGHYLENRLQAAQQAGVTHPFRDADIVPRDLHLLEYVTDAAQQAPGAFIEHVWPPMHTIIEAALKPSREDRLQMDDVWLRRHFGEVYADLDDQLLLGAEHAFRGLAKDSPSEFVALAETLRDTNSETVVFLLFEAYAANPSAFADEALDSLSTDPRRLRVGYSDSDEWQTRRLLEAVTSHASDEAIIRLEPVVLSFFTSWEKSAAGHRQFGLSQFALLGGVDPVRRTPAMRKRFAEWQRKFLLEDAPPPIGIFGGMVQSPIAGEAAAKMSDTQWLKAMRRYGDDDFHSRRDFLTGGAHQLSSVLEARAKAEPERFAALASGMPDDTNVAYFEAILRGVVDSDGGPSYDQTIALLLRCHALPGRPTGRWIARPLRHHLDQPLPDAIIDMLEWYATQDPDPGADPGGDADRPVHEGLAQHGLNSVRGGLAYELARFVWHRPDLIKPLLPSIASLVADPTMAVRSMAADIIVALLRDGPNRALELFDRLMTDATDDLLAIRSINDVMRYRSGPDFARLQPHLERMVNSPVQATQTSGAALASIAALSNDEARELADACAAGTVTQRIGAAKVCAANLTSAGYRARCEQQLVAFFDDPSKEVRDAAAAVVRRFEGDGMREYALLIAAFNRSTAGEENVDDLLFAFSEMTSVAADIALDACAEILERMASGDPDARLQGLHADQVSQILVRVYADGDAAVMNRALDLIDQSLELNLYGVSRALADHDRPWLAASP